MIQRNIFFINRKCSLHCCLLKKIEKKIFIKKLHLMIIVLYANYIFCIKHEIFSATTPLSFVKRNFLNDNINYRCTT